MLNVIWHFCISFIPYSCIVYDNCAIVIDPEHPNSCSKCSFLFRLLSLMPCSCASSLGDGVSSWLPTQDVVQQLVLAK